MGKQPLTRARIIAAAITLADREGLPSVSLRRIAARLGVHVTSLYNHVPTKEAVLDGMVEFLIESAGLPAKVSGWEDWVRQFAAGLRRVAHLHPGAVTVLHHRPVQGPKAAKFPEAGLVAFRAAGCNLGEAYNAVKTTALVVLGLMLEDVAQSRRGTPRTRLSALPAGDFRQARQLDKLATRTDVWCFAIDALVAGLAVKLRKKASRPRKSPAARKTKRG